MKLTIIIPVYNVSSLLRKCVETIIDKKLGDYEVLLVDDGSTDGSAEICDSLAEESTHIRVIHQKNGGLSSARNTGLKRSHSEYVTFIDSDDFLEPGTLPRMMNILKAHPEYDILEYDAVIAYGSPHQHRLHLGRKEYTDMKEYWIGGKAYSHAYAWNKIYRRSLFSGIRFPQDKVFEDVFTLPLILEHAQIVATTSHGTYYYCYNSKGITASAGTKELCDLLEAHKTYIETYTDRADWSTKSFAYYFAHVTNILLDTGINDRYWTEIARNVPAVTSKLMLMKYCGIGALRTINTLWHKIVPRKRS
ncbi:MAG: glycosyltransferase family 2 protein [Prevotella sp.]|nr:glycosyltransferase family 2 protein [Prevotella sp.]